MESVSMKPIDIQKKVRAIVCFGPATPHTGFKAGDYYQVTIDPNCCSPSGEYIRFGLYGKDEITGWQRVAAMTICELLSDSTEKVALEGYIEEENAKVTMRSIGA